MATRSDIHFAAPQSAMVDLLIVAGEHSGDQHAAKVVRELRRRHPTWAIAALGGPELQKAGAQLLFDLTASSVVGLVEVLRNYGFFKALFDETLAWVGRHQPRAVCFVDYPGFNLRLARALKEKGLSVRGGGSIKTLFYISPQIWAWKARRRFSMAESLDAMAVIFPFETECYADTSLKAEFVGHPFVADDYDSPVHYDPEGTILLLPGSRREAVSRIYPLMLAGFAAFGDRRATVLYPSREVESVLRDIGVPENIELRPTGQAVGAAAVLTSSGTMSMHCALAGIPGAIVYRANPLTYLIGRWLVKVPYLGIANLLLKEPMYPEYIQGAATPNALAGELRECLQSPQRRAETQARAERLRGLLQQPAAGTAADWIERHLEAVR